MLEDIASARAAAAVLLPAAAAPRTAQLGHPNERDAPCCSALAALPAHPRAAGALPSSPSQKPPASPTTSLRALRAPQLSADLVGAKKKKKKKKKKSKGVKSTANIAFQDHLDKIELQLGECRSADGAGKESKAA